MNKILRYLFNALLSLTFMVLIACTGAQVGLNEFKLVNPTAPFLILEPSLYPADGVGDVVKELIRSYQQYGALFSALEKESPTVENTCYELADKVKKVKPLLRHQNDLLVRTQEWYTRLEALRKGNFAVESAVKTGKLFVAKAKQRIQKHDELMDITNSFTDDCPSGSDWVVHLAFGITGLAQYQSARAKAPLFNKTASEVEELSAQEKTLASNVVQSLKALR